MFVKAVRRGRLAWSRATGVSRSQLQKENQTELI